MAALAEAARAGKEMLSLFALYVLFSVVAFPAIFILFYPHLNATKMITVSVAEVEEIEEFDAPPSRIVKKSAATKSNDNNKNEVQLSSAAMRLAGKSRCERYYYCLLSTKKYRIFYSYRFKMYGISNWKCK